MPSGVQVDDSRSRLLSDDADCFPETKHHEDTPAYEALRARGLLCTSFRKRSASELILLAPSTNSATNLRKQLCAMAFPPVVGFCYYQASHLVFTVPAGHVQRLRNDSGGYELAGPGMHDIESFFWTSEGSPMCLDGVIQHGDITIVTIEQGYIGYAIDNGQPVLLPPGLHQWRSQTMNFVQSQPLNDHAVVIGPYTLLTVDEGYSAVTQNNGKQVILPGGHVHLLDHKNWKFEKFMTLKIQTDNLQDIKATSADNILMMVTSTVNWRIDDVETAAVMAAETMAMSGRDSDVSADISKLRNDVLKQAVASLAAFIGGVNYSDSFHVAAAASSANRPPTAVGLPAEGVPLSDGAPSGVLFDEKKMHSAVESANRVTATYGIRIISINVISAQPVDQQLTRALASGAVAAAEALQAETAARGAAKAQIVEAEARADAVKIQAEGEARAAEIRARGEGEGERLRAKAARDAADLISGSDVAITLAKMDKAAAALGQNSKVFFAKDPGVFPQLGLYEGSQPGQ